MMRLLVTVLLLLLVQRGMRMDVSAHDESWVDPTDMLQYDPMSKTMRQEIVREFRAPIETPHQTSISDSHESVTADDDVCNPIENQHCNSVYPEVPTKRLMSNADNPQPAMTSNRCESPFIARHVRRLLRLFNVSGFKKLAVEEVKLMVQITLTEDDIAVLKLYANSEGSIQDVDRVLGAMMNVVDLDGRSWVDDVKESLIREEWSEYLLKNVLYVFVVIVLIVLLKWMLGSGGVGLYGKLFFGLLVMSIVWEWFLLYQEAEVDKRTQRSKFDDIPKECRPSTMSYLEMFMSSFNRGDRCKEYHGAMMIDSHWSVSPLYAASSVLAKTMPAFGGGLGGALGKFFTGYMDEFGYFEKYFMAPFAVALAALFIMYPITAAVKTMIIHKMIKTKHQPRVMVEDVQRAQVEALQPVESSPVIQHHNHHYYFAANSTEKPDSSGDILVDDTPSPQSSAALMVCCHRCKSSFGMPSEEHHSTQEVHMEPTQVMDACSTSEEKNTQISEDDIVQRVNDVQD